MTETKESVVTVEDIPKLKKRKKMSVTSTQTKNDDQSDPTHFVLFRVEAKEWKDSQRAELLRDALELLTNPRGIKDTFNKFTLVFTPVTHNLVSTVFGDPTDPSDIYVAMSTNGMIEKCKRLVCAKHNWDPKKCTIWMRAFTMSIYPEDEPWDERSNVWVDTEIRVPMSQD